MGEDNGSTKRKFPVGMILILILLGFGIVSSLFSLFDIQNQIFQLGPFLIEGAAAVIINFVILLIWIMIFIGVLKRSGFIRKFAIGWFTFSILLGIINMLSVLINSEMYVEYYKRVFPEVLEYVGIQELIIGMVLISFISLIVHIIIMIYLYKKKDFFQSVE